ncbi:MAG TPA: alpha/beta hydrolase [Rhizomicrobium sp.]|nr:alpha/beta hydrolase [Rhizomicrobium sp.]
MAIQTREFTFDGADGEKVFCYRWSSSAPTRGVLQIAHGMGEHALRYLEPLTPIIESGIVVYANDHRGHGRTAKTKDDLGDFGARGFPALADDMAILSRLIRKENPQHKLILLGHSMGSFALQVYLPDHSDLIDGAVISGSAAMDLLAAGFGKGVTLDSIGAGDSKPRTPFDWLSRDDNEVDKYIADPLCGFSAKDESRGTMFAAGLKASEQDEIKKIRRDLPIYLFAGDKDPVNNNMEWLTPLVERYRAAGITDVTTDFYKDGRHEMLNETNREEVVRNLARWIDRVIAA